HNTMPYHTVPYRTYGTVSYHPLPYIPYHTLPYHTISYHTTFISKVHLKKGHDSKRSCSVLKFKNLSTSNSVPIPVLVVYPAENSAFQHAVVMLAEFLQLHGGCKVAIDLWQQGKVAEKGPLRWLSEQTKAAEHVLIVSPLGEASSSLLQNKQTPPEHSIPAAAHDLYPLILNMVASQAKCSSELAKFSVVHLSKKPCVCLPELKVCRSFYLMKDLNNLCKKLQKPRKAEKKIVWMLFKPGLSHNKKDSAKLKSALETLCRSIKQDLFKVSPHVAQWHLKNWSCYHSVRTERGRMS
uniref:SEFIR domain-containing protein n=1 Tax=Nothobranchius furzeri TaxID=105023 RepID=A0A8C6PI17_NOTFU